MIEVKNEKLIAMVINPEDGLSSRYLSVLWPFLHQSFRASGYSLLPLTSDNLINQKHLEGAVLVGATSQYIHQCQAMGIPHVCIGPNYGSFWVSVDDFSGCRLAAEYLIESGCQKICFVSSNQSSNTGQLRYQGYLTSMANHSLAVRRVCIGDSEMKEITAYRCISPRQDHYKLELLSKRVIRSASNSLL